MTNKGNRPTIGLLIGRLGAQRYQAHVWPGIADAARAHDVNLICFVGRPLQSPNEFDAQRNVAYDLVSAENADGLVLMSGTLGHYIGPAQLKDFYERYRTLPKVSIALAIEGIPSIVTDNETGMRDAIIHLVQVHGYRHIAFIRGPEGHQEAEARYRAYVQVLSEHGIPFDPDLVTPGDFVSATGVEAISLLLDRRKARFEAIVAANDETALGVMEALQRRGLRVPDDVAVVGFDDIEEAWFTTPPLTTVRQPLYEQGRQATEMLLALLAGEQVPMQVTLPTELVVRQSCGCPSQAITQAAAGRAPQKHSTLESGFAAKREQIRHDLAQTTVPSDMNHAWTEQLLDTWVAELTGTSPGAFLPTLDTLLRRTAALGGNVNPFQDAISVLRRHALPYLTGDARSRAEDLWHQARVLIGEIAQWAQAHRRLHAMRLAQTFSEIGESLMTAFDVAGLTDVMARQLPRLGLRRCYLSLYEPPVEKRGNAPTDWARLILAYNEHGRIALEPEGRRFPSRQLVPDGLLSPDERHAMVIEPLHFRDQVQLGFIVFEPLQHTEAAVRELLSGQIGTALQGALLMQARTRAEERLREYSEQLEKMVEERTRALQEAQEELVRKEKLAVLGQLAGGIAHELRNPLGLIKGSTLLLEAALQESDPELVRKTLEILKKGVKKSERIIDSLLGFAQPGTASHELVDVNHVIREVLSDTTVPENVQVLTWLDESLPTILADPEQLSLVFGNLILNSIQAMPEGGRLTIETSATVANEITVRFTDTGIGISEEHLDRLFEPLFTTKARGIGLGLAIVKALVESHGGHIVVESKVGGGTTFMLSLPLDRKASTRTGGSS